MSKIEIKFDELYALPSGWQWSPLETLMVSPKQDIVDGPFGSNLKASEYTDVGVPIARLQNIERNEFVYKNIKYVSKDKAKFLGRHNFKPGDILITKLGYPLGEACIAPEKIKTGIIVADLVRVRVPEGGIDRKYLTYAINSPFLIKQFENHTKGTTRPRVNLGVIRQLPIPLAPLNQQKRIVAEIEKQFSRLDEAVANLKRVKANLKRYKAAVLKAAVEGKLTEEWRKQHPDVEPADKLLERILAERREKWQGRGKYKEPIAPDTTDLPELPEGWVWTKSDQLFSFVTSGSRGWAKYYSESGSIFLRMGNLDHDTIDLDLIDIQRVTPPINSEGTRTRVTAGDILISITADVGMVGLVPGGLEEAYINQHVSLARPVRLDCSIFIAWFFACKSGQDQFRNLQRGATKVGLGLTDIKAVNLPLPPLPEQRAILSEIDRHLSVIDDADSQVGANLYRAVRLRQSILKKAFSGNLF